jgi:uncharacterized protein (TIGR02996 family)
MDKEESAFRRVIAENPDDPAPRLIFADWLDERGRLMEAAELRSLRLAAASSGPSTWKLSHRYDGGGGGYGGCGGYGGGYGGDGGCGGDGGDG